MMAPGMPTNIGTSSLRMPTTHSAAIVNAVDISPQKATRPVLLASIRLRSFSDSTLIRSGRNSTSTAHSAIMPAANSVTIALAYFARRCFAVFRSFRHTCTCAGASLPLMYMGLCFSTIIAWMPPASNVATIASAVGIS